MDRAAEPIGAIAVACPDTGPEAVQRVVGDCQRFGVILEGPITTAHSLSVEPEVMVVSINLSSSTWAAINRHRHFCVNVLRADQIAIADRFAGRGGLKGQARYEGARWSTLASGALALEGALAEVDCTVEDTIVRHSHALILGSVRHVVSGEPSPAPIYHHGAYGFP
ncbi:flavin reductase family protein [Mesorhizobium sp. C416B]|nr:MULTISPECIES: flavin reductase family protein [unclassified Mesorhizobium]WJI66144.1 flavin reductase family protein [Mesorhizobium sp. C416B]